MSEKMQAGRELDVDVAERVMGWIWIDMAPATGTKWLMPPNSLDRGQLKRDTAQVAASDSKRAPNWSYALPAYSSDIPAAWQVVDHMREQGWSLVLRDQDERTHQPVWEVEFNGILHDGWAQAKTPALAICRAALAAVSQEPAP